MSQLALGDWALVGTEPAGRFLQERLRIRADFPLVAVCRADADSPSEFQSLLDDGEITGLILTVPPSQRGGLIRAALAAGKRVLVESSPGFTSVELSGAEMSSALSEGWLGVFHVKRADHDFHSALAAVRSGRLGTLRTVRYVACDLAAPALPGDSRGRPDWRDTLSQTGPVLFDELAEFAGPRRYSLSAWPSPSTSGFQVRLEDVTDFSAWFDVHRAALCDLRTGWVLEGSCGAYHAGRLLTQAPDGELLEEEIPPGPAADDDVISELLELAANPDAARNSLRRALETCVLLDAIKASAETRLSVVVPWSVAGAGEAVGR